MAIIWKDNFQIKTPHSTPKCTDGPALAVFGDNLYMVYVGEGGENLWSCYLPGGRAFNGWNNWQENKQIKISHDNVPLSSFRPALLQVRNYLYLVYRGKDSTDVWWSWFDGANWGGNIKLPYPANKAAAEWILHNGMPEPALGAFANDQAVLILREHGKGKNAQGNISENDYLVSFTSPFTFVGGPQNSWWNPPSPLGAEGITPAATVFPIEPAGPFSTLVLVTDTRSGEFRWSRFTGAWTPMTTLQNNGTPPTSAGGAALAVLNNLLYAVYPELDGKTLGYTTINSDMVSSGDSPVQSATSMLTTSAPIGAATFNNSVCIAYKGEKNDDILFAHYP